MLNLGWNGIGQDGAEHLANAIQHNTVQQLLRSYMQCVSVSINTDTHHAKS